MSLLLKSLELQGYKTFASRTTLEFPGMITAIVGPNGSGKSNITDGLRWVLGEQSYSLLRGKKTEDMIFTGSEQRPRAGMAACTIVFDNTSGWLPIEYSDVAITRRAYRDGQNEYLLNGQKVRLKDISELLAQSGLSERNYAIIGQGLIDNSLALRPEERRKLFEEAAGIGLYRTRRIESLNRLETTRRNMERVGDILAELQPRLNILEKQAKKAEDYDRIKADLKLVLREWYGYHWHKGQADIASAKEFQKSQELALETVKSKHQEINTQISELRGSVNSLRDQVSEWRAHSVDLLTKRDRMSKDLAVDEEKHRSLITQTHALEGESARLEEEVNAAKLSLGDVTTEADSIKSELDTGSAKEKEISERLAGLSAKRTELEGKLEAVKRRVADMDTSVIRLKAQIEEKKARQTSLDKTISELEKSTRDLTDSLKSSTKEKDDTEGMVAELSRSQNTLDGKISGIQSDHALLQKTVNQLLSEKQKLENDISKLEIEMDMLAQAEKNLVGYPSGAKAVLLEIRSGKVSGLDGALSSQIIVQEQYETAILAALGDFSDAVILAQWKDTQHSLSILEDGKSGKTALLSEAFPRELVPWAPPQGDGAVGIASSLVTCQKAYSEYIKRLLSHTLVITERDYAVKFLPLLPVDGRLVTLKGEVFHPDGRIVAGKPNPSATISRPRQKNGLQERMKALHPLLEKNSTEISELQNRIAGFEKEIAALLEQKKEQQKKLDQANAHLLQFQVQVEKEKRQLEWSTGQVGSLGEEKRTLLAEIAQMSAQVEKTAQGSHGLNEEMHTLRSDLNLIDLEGTRKELAFIQTSQAVNHRALDELLKRLKEKEAQIRNGTIALDQVKKRIDDNQAELTRIEAQKKSLGQDEIKYEQQMTEFREKIEPAEEKLKQEELRYSEFLAQEENIQQQVNNAERFNTQAQMEYIRKKESMELLRRKIEEDFGLVEFDYAADVTGPNPLPFEGMVEQLPVVKELSSELEESISRQKSLMRRIGAVNPEAREEYLSTQERYDFLRQQIDDLTEAESNLRRILSDLDALMKTEFRQTFDAVAAEFPRMFNQLFGGGSARLVLSDPEDINESGIEIHARLPGKREQELTLLSGGERSLTAVALVFALLKVSPTPFCVLDEVDAMLDESNVGRFRDLLVELSREVQFILVTHNRNTVQAADIIYGITMGRDSSSQMVSLRIDQITDEMLSSSR